MGSISSKATQEPPQVKSASTPQVEIPLPSEIVSKVFDYIICGGGISGCVLAARLSQKYPSRSILLLEAGPCPEGHPLIGPPMACYAAHRSELDWNYMSVPQKHWGRKPAYQSAGKMLSGGSATNYGVWTRGPSCEYDMWAEMVGDEGWSWKGLLPYFVKVFSSCLRYILCISN